ncbi:MAG TPA: hypothetical protein VK574_04380 [Terracidiphilus sp.]|nr:hypothetical protein [Terracidiphilus sp.]
MIEGFLVALGISSSVVVRLVGDLFVAEIAMIVTFPFVLAFSIRRLQRPYLIRLFVLLGLWFLAQVLSDAYNHTVWLDRMRGMAGIIVFTTEIAFLAMVVAENERRKTIFITAFAIGSVVLTRYQPNVAAIGLEGADAWKWSYSFGVTILALLASSLLAARGRQVFALLLLIGVSAIDLLMNSRSAFLMLLVSTVLAFPIIPDQIGRFGLLPQRNNLFRVAMVVVLALAAGWSANQLLRLVTRSGLISEEAQEKNESEAQAGNLLLGGRPEVFIGLHAVMDSPVLGHGSWARDMKYTEMQYDLMQEYGINGDLTDTEADTRGLIPSHSHIIGAWVYAGLFGAIFWGYVIWLLTNAIVIVAVRRPPMAPVYSWLLVGFFWNILFSPFGSTSRIFEAFILIAIVDLLKLRVPADRTLRGKASWHRVPITRPSLAGGHVG